MTTSTDRIASHYLVREYYDGTPVTVETYAFDSMQEALELRDIFSPQEDGVVSMAFVVFTDGTEQQV